MVENDTMKNKIIKLIFKVLKKIDYRLYCDIGQALSDAKWFYKKSIEEKERNNEYNKIKLDEWYDRMQVARIAEIEKVIF